MQASHVFSGLVTYDTAKNIYAANIYAAKIFMLTLEAAEQYLSHNGVCELLTLTLALMTINLNLAKMTIDNCELSISRDEVPK